MSIITALRTVRITERANVVWLEIETDEGLVGLGESFRGAATVELAIHELLAPHLLGQDSEQIEYFSRLFMNPVVGFGASSAEVRAASAVDLALWDLKGKRYGKPLYQLLGGLARPAIPAYNTCAGYSYNSSSAQRRSVTGGESPIGPYDDQIAFMCDAGDLARSLVDEGYKAMKIWPFDAYATVPGSHYISNLDLKAGLEPFAKARRAVGDRIDIMCELHSYWGGPAAQRICRALEDYGVLWAEDPLCKNDDVHALADLRMRTSTPICVSETLGGLVSYRDVLFANAVDYIMVDLAWCGGLSVGRKIAALAESFAKPISPHDCTGPVVLMAGLHLALSSATAIFQEVVRAYISTWYAETVTSVPEIRDGMVLPPVGPGLGADLKPEIKQRADAVMKVSRM